MPKKTIEKLKTEFNELHENKLHLTSQEKN